MSNFDKKRLINLENQLKECSQDKGSELVAKEISETVESINDSLIELSKGKNPYSTSKSVTDFFKKIIRETSDIADVRTYKFFLNANSRLFYYISRLTSFDYNTTKVTAQDFPIIKSITEDTPNYYPISKIEEVKTSSVFIYPLNIVFYYGDNLQNVILYDDETKFNVNSFEDISNYYKLFYFDFKTSCFKHLKDDTPVINDFMQEDSKHFLKLIPEYGYLFELGRINLKFNHNLSSIAQKGLKMLEESSKFSSHEMNDYVRYMMVEFSKMNHDIKQNEIVPIDNLSYIHKGSRKFIINAHYGTFVVEVDLEKYGSERNRMVWDDKALETIQFLTDYSVSDT